MPYIYPMADVEDLLTEAQDYFFENNLPEAERICKQVVASHPHEGDAYSLLCVIYTQLGRFADTTGVAKEWGKKAGYSPGQLRIQAENGFLVDDVEAVQAAAEKLLSHKWKEPVGIFVKVLMAALCSDLGESSLAGRLLNSCEGETMEEDEETLVDIFVAWAELRLGNERRTVGIEALRKTLTSENVHYKGLAQALLALNHINEGNLEEAEKEISEHTTSSDDANIAGVRALLGDAKKGASDQEWKQWAEQSATGSNVLIKKHIWKLLASRFARETTPPAR